MYLLTADESDVLRKPLDMLYKGAHKGARRTTKWAIFLWRPASQNVEAAAVSRGVQIVRKEALQRMCVSLSSMIDFMATPIAGLHHCT